MCIQGLLSVSIITWPFNPFIFPEPDLPHGDVQVSANQLTKDFAALKSLVTTESSSSRYTAGPDVAVDLSYFAEYVFHFI